MPRVLRLASTSPQRAAILTQLGVPFELVTPAYDESAAGDPLTHACGKARSVDAGAAAVLGVDTVVVYAGRQLGKPADSRQALRMLEALSGATHEVVSGLCLRTSSWEERHLARTAVTFRPIPGVELERYVASGEWRGRAGAYAIQGLGGSLVERIDGDYLNVVGLPGFLLVSLLAKRFPGEFGFGGPPAAER